MTLNKAISWISTKYVSKFFTKFTEFDAENSFRKKEISVCF